MALAPLSQNVSKKRNTGLLAELDKHKAEIEFLYCVDQLPLKRIIEDINGRYGLNGTYYQYRDRLAAWGCRRRVKRVEWLEIQKQLLVREKMGMESEVYLNEITNIPMNRVKRGLSRNITATDMLFMNSRANMEDRQMVAMSSLRRFEHPVSIRSPQSWDSITLPPIPRNISRHTLKNLPISITDRHLLRILQPMVMQHPQGSNQITTINTNKYHVFLRTMVYSISNNLVRRREINRQLDLVNKFGYRRPLMALLSQELISIAAVCERLLPLLYLREDEELLLHIRRHHPDSISYFSILGEFIELWDFDVTTGNSPTVGRESYPRALRRLAIEITALNIRAKSLEDAKTLFSFSKELGDFTPFSKLTSPDLVPLIESWNAEVGGLILWTVDDWPQTQILLEVGFRVGFETKLLDVLVLEDHIPTSHSWRDWWEITESSKLPKLMGQHTWENREFQEFDRVFMGVIRMSLGWYSGDLDFPLSHFVDIWRSMCLLWEDVSTTVLWEIGLVADLIVLNPDTLGFFVAFLQHKYPDVGFQTYIFHIILRESIGLRCFPLGRWSRVMRYYDVRPNRADTLCRLLQLGSSVNPNLDLPGLEPPITFLASRSASVNWYTESGNYFDRALYHSLMDSDFDPGILDILLSTGANADDFLSDGELWYSSFRLIAIALERRRCFHEVELDGATECRFEHSPLQTSILCDNVIVMEYLIDYGIDPLYYMRVITDHYFKHLSAIQLAAGSSFACLKALVDRGFDINQPPCSGSDLGSTTLHQAILSSNLRNIAYLLHKGADIYAPCSGYGDSALEYAISSDRLDAVSLILQSEPACQSLALSFAEKHHKAVIAKYIRDWTPSSHENTTEADIEMFSKFSTSSSQRQTPFELEI
ncbi:hypothetical protein TWF281_009394 [Arthrobotrys megalospora]